MFQSDFSLGLRWQAKSLVGLLALASLSGCQISSQGLNSEGTRLYTKGDYPGAINRFQRSIGEDPNNPDPYYNLGRSYHQLAKVQGSAEAGDAVAQAERYYNQCLDHDKDHRECYRALAVLLVEQGNADKAFRLLEGWSLQSPSNPSPLVELGRLHEEYGEMPQAKERLLEAIALAPQDPQARAALGRLHERAGNYQQALSNYQISLNTDRFQAGVRNRIAMLQQSMGVPAGSAPTSAPPATIASPSRTILR